MFYGTEIERESRSWYYQYIFNMEVDRAESGGVRPSVVMLENSKMVVMLEERNNMLIEDIRNIAPGSKIALQYNERCSVVKCNPCQYHNVWPATYIAFTNATARVLFAHHSQCALEIVRSVNSKSCLVRE